jgi:hypothetical protein
MEYSSSTTLGWNNHEVMLRHSKCVSEKFLVAEELIKKLSTRKAFEIFKSIAMNSRLRPEERADAYASMGELIECWDPSLAPGDDESGLVYYQCALLLDSDNFDALYGIVRSFGEAFPNHQDIDAFELAYNNLMRHKLELDRYNLRPLLKKQYTLMSRIKKEQGERHILARN